MNHTRTEELITLRISWTLIGYNEFYEVLLMEYNNHVKDETVDV